MTQLQRDSIAFEHFLKTVGIHFTNSLIKSGIITAKTDEHENETEALKELIEKISSISGFYEKNQSLNNTHEGLLFTLEKKKGFMKDFLSNVFYEYLHSEDKLVHNMFPDITNLDNGFKRALQEGGYLGLRILNKSALKNMQKCVGKIIEGGKPNEAVVIDARTTLM